MPRGAEGRMAEEKPETVEFEFLSRVRASIFTAGSALTWRGA